MKEYWEAELKILLEKSVGNSIDLQIMATHLIQLKVAGVSQSEVRAYLYSIRNSKKKDLKIVYWRRLIL